MRGREREVGIGKERGGGIKTREVGQGRIKVKEREAGRRGIGRGRWG